MKPAARFISVDVIVMETGAALLRHKYSCSEFWTTAFACDGLKSFENC